MLVDLGSGGCRVRGLRAFQEVEMLPIEKQPARG